MKTIESNLKSRIIEAQHFEMGDLYFFENLVISEIHEGKHLCLETANDYLIAISEFYGDKKPFGYISNRVNSFSIEALDFPVFIDILENLKEFLTITYKNADEMNAGVEKLFCPITYEKSNSLHDGFISVNQKILEIQ